MNGVIIMIDFNNLGEKTNFTSFKATQGFQFGKSVVTIQCTVNEIIKFVEIDQNVQRELVSQHVANIQKYIQYGIDGNMIFFSPFIFSSRGQGRFDKEAREYKLSTEDKLVILDGQHRIRAFENIIKMLEVRATEEDYQKLSYIKEFQLSLQIYENLSEQQEKQLFADVNTKSSAVSNTLLLMYKDNELANKLVKEIIYGNSFIKSDEYEVRGRSTLTKFMTVATLYNIILILNEKRIITELQLNKINEQNYEAYKHKTILFLNLLKKYAPHDSINRKKYIILNPKVLHGIAFYIANVSTEENMEQLFKEVIYKTDWTHSNLKFEEYGVPYSDTTKRYNFSNGVRSIKSIANYLFDNTKV